MVTCLATNAQEDCKVTVTKAEDGTEIKTIPEYMMYERVFGGTSQFMFFSIVLSDGMPILNFQLLAKSKDFPKVLCLDKTSKIHIQLMSGKVVTLLSAVEEQCGSLIYDNAEKNNLRVLTGAFLFTTGSLEELEKSAISFIRVQYATETIDYPVKKELQSEGVAQKYYPDSFFIRNLKCFK